MDDASCVNHGNPKDVLLTINQGTVLAIQAKIHDCLLDTVL